MKITKPLIITALVVGGLFAGNLALYAQNDTNTPPAGAPPGPPRGGMRGGPTLEQLTKALSLTDDQKPKVKSVLDARDQKMKDLRADTSLSQEDRRTKMQTIRQETTAGLKKVLTPEQFTKFQEMNQRNRRPGGGAPPAGNPPANPPQ